MKFYNSFQKNNILIFFAFLNFFSCSNLIKQSGNQSIINKNISPRSLTAVTEISEDADLDLHSQRLTRLNSIQLDTLIASFKKLDNHDSEILKFTCLYNEELKRLELNNLVEEFQYDQKIIKKFPQVIFDRCNRFGSSLIVDKNTNIFIEGYYRNLRFKKGVTNSETFDNFLKRQPYFKYNSNNDQYELNLDSQNYFYNTLSESSKAQFITLYRGMTEFQAQFIEALKLLRKKNISTGDVNKIIAVINNYERNPIVKNELLALINNNLELLSHSDRKSLSLRLIKTFFSGPSQESFFMTPQRNAAEKFALSKNSNFVMKSKVDKLLMHRFLNKNMYIGFEYNYYEVLFIEPELIAAYVDASERVLISESVY